MAKKSKKKESESKEAVTNCDQLDDKEQLAVAICDLKNINIESLIRTIRGQKVMVDFDLAMLDGVQTKSIKSGSET